MERFADKVYSIVRLIPKGKVVSYGQIARFLGRPRGARQVGWAMASCPEGLPWHRVVMTDGSIAGGQYGGLRASLLVADGVPVSSDRKVDMARHAWFIDVPDLSEPMTASFRTDG